MLLKNKHEYWRKSDAISYSLSKLLHIDLRNLIIDEYLKSGRYTTFGYLPVTNVCIASRFNVSANTFSKIWKKFCNER